MGVRKEHISSPFNFQHLTHTRPHHLPSLEQASQQELANEFRTVRASQAPHRELFGIKATDINANLPSPPPAPSSDASPTTAGSMDSFEVLLPSAPLPSVSRAGSEKSTSHRPQVIKKARSVESFSQPFVKPRSPRSTTDASESSRSPINPPPRTSSRSAHYRTFESTRPAIESPVAPTFSLPDRRLIASTGCGDDASLPHDTDGTNEGWPIAVSTTITPDESLQRSNPVVTPGYSTDLEDVPEEAENYFQYRGPRRTRAASSSSSLRHSRSFPEMGLFVARSGSRGSSKAKFRTSNAVGSDEALDSPLHSLRSSPASSNPRQHDPFTVVSESLDSSWEDVIDYCYDHAAEADCEFDWDRASTVEAVEVDDGLWMPKRTLSIRRRPSERRSTSVLAMRSSSSTTPPRTRTNVDRPQIIVPDISTVPELASKSATSLGTASSVPTPSDNRGAPQSFRLPSPYGEPNSLEDERLVPTSTTFPSKLHLYEEGLICDTPSDHETGIYRPRFNEATDNRYSGPESIRSHISKCSSEDSFVRPAALTRVSTSSISSLPDLVYSRRSTRFHIPNSSVIEEQSPIISPVDSNASSSSTDAEPSVPARGRNSLEYFRSARLSQSVAPPNMRAPSPSALRGVSKRASSATRRETPTPTPPSGEVPRQLVQIDPGTRDLLQIGRPRKGDVPLSLFPPTRGVKEVAPH
ncbi:MAG: hypothetical protein Q9165_004669 [Trypethelium subeluteriae]